MLGLDVTKRSQDVNQGELLLLLGLGPLSKRYRLAKAQCSLLREFRKIGSIIQDEPFVWKSPWKELEWA